MNCGHSCAEVFRMFEGYYGPYFTPSVDADGNLTWTNNAGLPDPAPINIKGEPGTGLEISGLVATEADLPATAEDWTCYLVGTEVPYTVYTYNPNSGWISLGQLASGPKGDPGAVYTPSVSPEGILSWTNDGGLPNPEPVNIKGSKGDTGEGVPAGGTTRQVLTKLSDQDYDAGWQDPQGNYNDLSNLPQIGGVTLQGNKTPAQLGLVAAQQGAGLIPDSERQQIQDNADDIAELQGEQQQQGSDLQQLQDDVDAIEAKIPNQASAQNQLADKDFVNSSINSAAAFFRGSFASRAALLAVAWQTSDPSAANYVSNNDYAYVQDDESQNDEAWRYIYVLETGGQNNGWQPQFRVNESPLTAAQVAALNSGATAALIAQITANQTAIGEKYTKPAAGIPASDLASAVQTSLNKADTAYQDVKNVTSNLPRNLFNGVVPGEWISATGAVNSFEGAAYTKDVEVIPNAICCVGFTITLESSLSQNHFVRIHGYDASDHWVSQLWSKSFQRDYSGSQVISLSIPDNVKYIRISFYFYDIISNLFISYDGYRRPYMDGFVQVQYPIDNDGHYTKGRIALPTNYSQNGVPVPLVVYVHASNAYGNIDGTIYANETGRENLQYILDNGYAIFDCYGYGNVYTSDIASNTFGIPINRKCYKSGIEHVLKNYNIDKENIFCSCKSLGGLEAISMFFDSGIPIKGFGLLAPELSILTLKLGYSAATKRIVATDLGFSEDVNHVLNFGQNDPIPEGFWDYVTENMEKWSGWFSIFNGLPISRANKPNYYNSPNTLGTMSRQSLNRPIKIWIASDDVTVEYNKSKSFIDSLVNGGNAGELRTMPANTGAHGAVDVSPDRLMTQDVTTRLGVHWDSITTAYVELVEWFDMLCTR